MPFSKSTDRELLDAIAHDDEKAFAELFKRHWRKVHAMAHSRVRSREVTEEIVQELFTSLWDKRKSVSINHLPSYLFNAVKYKALNYIESKLVYEKYWNYYKKNVPQHNDATELTVNLNELMEAIEEGMQHLPEKSKDVFRLNRLEGHSVSEIAGLLNLSEKTVEYHITRSLKQLRLHLKGHTLAIILILKSWL